LGELGSSRNSRGIEALLSCDYFLQIAEFKARRKKLQVGIFGKEANARGFVRRRDSGVRDATAI
jgi:hypothetical protein